MAAVATSPLAHRGALRGNSPLRTPQATAHPSASNPASGSGNNHNAHAPAAPLLLTCTPSDAAVDYDENVTPLYEHIGNSEWDAAASRCSSHPKEGATWVVRYRRDANGEKMTGGGKGDILWRFLPIHSACALNPPTAFLRTLLKAHPDGARTLDDQGMLPLHYACGARCSREVLYLLLMGFPQAALREDPNGMLPLHYLAQWGPREGRGESGVIDMVCVATGRKVGAARDGDGNTAEMLALRAEYAGHDAVARKIREFASRHATDVPGSPTRAGPSGSTGGSGSGRSPKPNLSVQTSVPRSVKSGSSRASGDKYSSFEDDAASHPEVTDDGKTVLEHEPEGHIEISLSGTPSNNRSNQENHVGWSNSVVTPRSSKNIMGKLGVSPAHSQQRNQDRYHSWDGDASQRDKKWDGGLNKEAGYRNNRIGHSPGSQRHARSFSWDHADHRPRDDPPASEQRHRNTFGGDAPSLSGSTWTTAMEYPTPMSSKRGTALPPKSPHSSQGFPPLSPRAVPTPKSRNQRGGGLGCSPRSQPRQSPRERREPNGRPSEQERQDRRLAELREELSGSAVCGSGSHPASSRDLHPISEIDTRISSGSSSSGSAERSAGYRAQLAQAEREEARRLEMQSAAAEREETRRLEMKAAAAERAKVRAAAEERARALAAYQADAKARAASEVTKRADEIKRLALEEERLIEEAEEAKRSELKMLEEDISRLEAERRLAAAAYQSQDLLRDLQATADEERAQIVAKMRAEKVQSENALLAEISRLKAEKDRAEGALAKITMLAPIWSSSASVDEDRVCDDDDDDDDGVSRLTFAEHDELEGGDGVAPSPGRRKMSAVEETDSVESAEVHRLLKEKASIERAIQEAKDQQSEAKGNHRGTPSADTTAAISDLMAKLSKQAKQLDKEKAKSAELAKEVSSLKKENEASTKLHSEAVARQLREVKSLRRSLDKAADEIEERNAGRGDFERKESEWNDQRRRLEADVKRANDKCWAAQNDEHKARADLKAKETAWDLERQRLESEIRELKLAGGSDGFSLGGAEGGGNGVASKIKLETAKREAEDMRKYNAAMRKEHDETIRELERTLDEERRGKTESLSEIVRLKYQMAALEQDMAEANDDAKAAREELRRLGIDRRDSGGESTGVEVELYQLKDKLRTKLEEAEKTRKALDKMKADFSDKEHSLSEKNERLQKQLAVAEDRVTELEAQLADGAASANQDEDSYVQQIRDLKKKIQLLQEGDAGNSHKLWEANKLRERAIQDKEDEMSDKMRAMRKEHEKAIIEMEDEHMEALREFKKKSEQALRASEEAYVKQLREAKRREQALIEKEDRLMSELNENKMKDSLTQREIDDLVKEKGEASTRNFEKIIRAKDEEHEREVARLEEELAELRRERKEIAEDKMRASELEARLLETKKDLERQRRKHKSEMNQLNNTLEMQKSKEGRLQSHIQSLEKQITDMVNDYETRLQDAFYDNM